jgi:hypothetical protein
MEGVDLLLGWHEEWPLFGLPWVATEEELSQWMSRWANKERLQMGWSLMVTHASIFPTGEEPPYEFISSQDWAKRMHIGACFYGHIHDPHGQYEEMADGPVVFCNNGALSRGSLHEKTLKRAPSITLYDDDEDLSPDQMFRRIEVPYRPATEAFRLVEVVEAKQSQGRLDEFLAEVGETQLAVSGPEEVLGAVEGMNLKPATRQAVRECVEEVSSR